MTQFKSCGDSGQRLCRHLAQVTRVLKFAGISFVCAFPMPSLPVDRFQFLLPDSFGPIVLTNRLQGDCRTKPEGFESSSPAVA